MTRRRRRRQWPKVAPTTPEHRDAYFAAVLARETFAERIADKIRTGALADGFTRRDIHQKSGTGLTSVHGVAVGLDMLVDREVLRRIDLATGGRPKTVYRIEAEVLASTGLPLTVPPTQWCECDGWCLPTSGRSARQS